MAKGPVLLVEDDPSDARLIQRAFSKLDATLAMIRLTNGDDVVSYLSGETPYDNRTTYPLPCIVLLDIKLPRRSGFEVLQWVRRQPTPINRLPVVMLTSSRHSVDINRAYDLGANSYLSKPETASQLEHLATRFQSYWLGINESPDLLGNVAKLNRL